MRRIKRFTGGGMLAPAPTPGSLEKGSRLFQGEPLPLPHGGGSRAAQIFNKDCRIASCDQGIRQASLFLQPIRPLPLWGRGGVGAAIPLNRTSVPNMIWREAQ